MVVMKGYVRNHAHLEGSMMEGYTTEEVIECCVNYTKDGKPIGVPVSRHRGRLSRKGTKRQKSLTDVTYQRVREAYFNIMHQLVVMRPYVEKHLHELREWIRDEALIMKQHKLHFTAWLKDLNIHVGETLEEKMIYLFAAGPHSVVKSWQAYDINGFTFYTKSKDSRSQCQNIGVRVDAEDSTWQKMLIMDTLKKFGKSIMEFRNSCIQMSMGEAPTWHWGGWIWVHNCWLEKCGS
jgi:hypothetical protein